MKKQVQGAKGLLHHHVVLVAGAPPNWISVRLNQDEGNQHARATHAIYHGKKVGHFV